MVRKPKRPVRVARRPVPQPRKPAGKAKPRPKVAAKPKPRPAPSGKASIAAKSAPAVRAARDEFEEETVCSLEFLSDGRSFVARLDTTRGGMREHKAPSFTDLLELVAEALREEFSEA